MSMEQFNDGGQEGMVAQMGDRLSVLRMVAEGKVSAEEAELLMSAIEQPAPDQTRVFNRVMAPAAPMLAMTRPNARRKLVIQVNEEGEHRVNICIPLSLARAATRLIPQQVKHRLADFEISLDQLLEELGQSDGDGVLVQIQDGDTQIRVAVE
jgi:hypothetical protein